MVAIIPSLSLSLEMSFLIAFCFFIYSERGFINLFCPVNSEKKSERKKSEKKKRNA